MFVDEELIKFHNNRLNALANIVLISFAILLSRLWYLQVYKGEILLNYSLKNRLRKEKIRAPRGMIFSRNKEILVDNIPRFDVILTPQFLSNKKETIKRLSEILKVDEKSIYKIIKNNSTLARYKSIIIKKNVSREIVAKIETENFNLPGISIDTFIARKYNDLDVGSHVLGHIAEINSGQLTKYRDKFKYNFQLGDYIGQFGLEKKYDSYLRGEDGNEFVQVDAYGRRTQNIATDNLFKGIKQKKAISGKNLRLTLDRDLQLAGYEKLEGKVGSVVAIDIKTGEVLAMVSRPSFDPSAFSMGLDKNYWNKIIKDDKKPMRNRVIQDHYSPGSTFKTLTAIVLLNEGIIDERSEVKCSGKFKVGRRYYHCWKKNGHGKVNIYKALRESCNIFFQKFSLKVDIDVFSKYAKMFGMGTKTNIGLSQENRGLVPTKDWKFKRFGIPWQKGETLSCVIGQSYMLATPIQIAQLYAAVASEGVINKPYLVKEIFTNNNEVIKSFSSKQLSEININPKIFKIVKKGLFQVVNNPRGTAWYRRGRGIMMAGKTGTSQVARATSDKVYAKCEKMDYNLRHHALFAGFAPYDDPKIAVAAIVEHGCHGSSAAGPVAQEVIQKYMKKYHKDKYDQIYSKEQKKIIQYLKRKKAEELKKEIENNETI